MSGNPFFETWDTPFGVPPFDRIAPDHIPPALDRGMREQLDEVATIARSALAPTFANTIEALERSGKLLERTSNVFGNLVASRSSDALEAIDLEYAPRLAQHGLSIALDPDLFRRIADLHARRDELGLAEDQKRLLERTHRNLVRSGAALAPAQKERMLEISERLALLETRFGQNVLHDEKSWTMPLAESGLDGLPGFVRAACRRAAEERGHDGHVVTLARSSVEPFLTFSARRDLRRAVYEAWVTRGAHPGAHDNRPLIPEIAALRAEQARLLGYASYAAYRLDDSMAKRPEAARELLMRVWSPARRRAEAERAELLARARADGLNGKLEAWDWRYYAERLRKERYDLDESELKPYFVLDRMVHAAFDTAARLFGVSLTERPDIPVYHPDVRAYEVREGERHVGVFLHDNYARPDKRSGAWMSSYRVGQSLDGPVSPIVVNNNNFARGEPTLLSFDEAETLFHEFGHALHGLLSRARYRSQSGTSVLHDFVEFPSQIYEHWLATAETLRTYARHHDTGEPLPERQVRRLLATRNFGQGFATAEFTASALLDLAVHGASGPGVIVPDDLERSVLAEIGMPPEIGPRHRVAHFQHVFAGSSYAAGYYAYMWAEVLDADGYAAFEEAGNPFDPDLAASLKEIYAAGDTRDPMELYVAFRGREPDPAALLRHRGLAEIPEQ